MKSRRIYGYLLTCIGVCLVAAVAAGCSATVPSQETAPTATPVAAEPQALPRGAHDALVIQAQEDLGGRLGVEADEIEVVEVATMIWPDASLGCPKPGMVYAQMRLEGLLIRLAHDGQEYAYHSGGEMAPFLCERESEVLLPQVDSPIPAPLTEPGKMGEDESPFESPLPPPLIEKEDELLFESPVTPDARLAPLVAQAKEDLAARLSLSTSEIEVRSAEPVIWPDAGLGCPKPGMVYAQVRQDGARIQLLANGQVYNYHSGRGRPPFLCENSIQPDKRSAPPSMDE